MTSMTRWPDRSPVIARSEATKQSSFAEPTLAKRKSASAREQKAGLLRCARNDGAVLTTASNPVIACDKRAAFALGAKRRSNPALRSRHQRRGNPLLPASKKLDCFAALAMTALGQAARQRSQSGCESSKATQIALGRASKEKGIRCNVIAPGCMDTPRGRDASRRRSGRRHGAFRPPGHGLGGRL